MSVLRDLLHIAAETLPIWRDAGIVLLASLVLACLFLADSIYRGE